MTPLSFRRSLLALAVSAFPIASLAVPAGPSTLVLDNQGIFTQRTDYAGGLVITGSFANPNPAYDAISFQGNTFGGDLVFNANTQVTSDQSSVVDMNTWEDNNAQLPAVTNTVSGNVINLGTLSIVGNGSSALLIDPANISGSVINQGLISATGAPAQDISENEIDVARGLVITGSSHVGGDVLNTAGGRILATGEDAVAVRLAGATVTGKLTNSGVITATGLQSTAVQLVDSEDGIYSSDLTLAGFENHGTLTALGEDAEGLRVDGVNFTTSTNQIVNTGVIQAQDAAIVVGDYAINANNASGLWIVNSGSLISADEAVDASEAIEPVYLRLTNGSRVFGNLIDLSNIEVTGNTLFTGNGVGSDGANIRMKDNGWVDVGAGSTPGHLQLGLAHTTLDGNLSVGSGSSLDMTLSNATQRTLPVLNVTGTAEFAQGSQVRLAASGSDFRASGSQYVLVKAGTLSGTPTVTSTSSLLEVNSYAVSGQQLVATVSAKNAQGVSDVIRNIGGSGNAQRAGGAFTGVITRLADLNAQDPLLQAYTRASNDPAALKALVEQLAPEINGGATQAATSGQALINNVTAGRTASGRGLSSGDTLKNTGVWVQTLYSDANQDLRDGVAGFNAYSRGIAVGADGQLNDQLTLGVAYSYLNTDVHSEGGNKTEVDGQTFTFYGGFEQGNYFVDGSLSYGFNDNQGKRYIAGTQAKGDYDSNLLGLNLVGGYTYRLNPQWLVEPRIAARYSRVDIDGYREKGSSAALKVEGQRYEAIELGAGARVAGRFNLGQGTLEPQAKLMAYHDFAADKASSTSTFLQGDTPFITSGASPVRNAYEAGVGVDYHLGAVTVGVSYDYLGKSGFDADTVSAKLRYDF